MGMDNMFYVLGVSIILGYYTMLNLIIFPYVSHVIDV